MSYRILDDQPAPLRFSIATLVTDFAQYGEMRDSFVAKGFTPADCEFLCIDNSAGNRFDAYAAINLALRAAQGRYVILCHQDVLLHADDRAQLETCIAEVTARDPQWGVLGNAGAWDFNDYALRISDPHGADTRKGGPFPVAVMSLDENFLLLRADANLGVSSDIGGFHLYGADLCLQAELRGYRSYVIDFHLRHLSGGSTGRSDDRDPFSFHQTRLRFIAKYRAALRSRWLNTTCTRMYLCGSSWRSRLGNLRRVIHYKRKFDRLLRRLQGGKRG